MVETIVTSTRKCKLVEWDSLTPKDTNPETYQELTGKSEEESLGYINGNQESTRKKWG